MPTLPELPSEPPIDPKTGQWTRAWLHYINELRRILNLKQDA